MPEDVPGGCEDRGAGGRVDGVLEEVGGVLRGARGAVVDVVWE